jgi:hypothetical protein
MLILMYSITVGWHASDSKIIREAAMLAVLDRNPSGAFSAHALMNLNRGIGRAS